MVLYNNCFIIIFPQSGNHYQNVEDGNLKLTDFGLAKWLGRRQRTRSICGTLSYMAPEILMSDTVMENAMCGQSYLGYGQSADWWSLGVIVYSLAFLRKPFSRPDSAISSNEYTSNVDGEEISSHLQMQRYTYGQLNNVHSDIKICEKNSMQYINFI